MIERERERESEREREALYWRGGNRECVCARKRQGGEVEGGGRNR